MATDPTTPAPAPAKDGTIPTSGLGGGADIAANGSGSAEAHLLGAKAVREVAAAFAEALCRAVTQAERPLLLLAASSAPGFQALAAFEAQLEAFQAERQHLLEASRPPVAASEGVVPGAKTLAAGVGGTLDAVNKLLGFFRTDFKFTGIEVASTDAMLLTALAEQLKARQRRVRLPGLYQPGPEAGSALQSRFVEPFAWLQQARARETDTRWKALADRLEAWITRLATADDKGVAPLHAACQQALLREQLGRDGVLVLLQLHKLTGGGYTEKNLWSSLGRNPFFVMGGAVAGMTAFDGQSGELLAASHLPRHGGYHSVSAIELEVNGSAFAGNGRPGWPTPL